MSKASAAIIWLAITGIGFSQDCTVERVSVSATGQAANGDCSYPTISHDGRYVAFGSGASNLVPGDSNNQADAFVFDRLTGGIELISVSTAGTQGNGHSGEPKLSADGRMVAFGSIATNLDPRDTDPVVDVYVHDRVTKTTTLVSERLGSGPSQWGCHGACISADGRYVAFDCLDDNVVPGDSNPGADVFVRDLVAQTTELVSLGPTGQQADNECLAPSISGDGRFVAFQSAASNWFPVGPTYAGTSGGIFIRDRIGSSTLAVTSMPSGLLALGVSESPSISPDARFVAFDTTSDRLMAGKQFCCQDVVRWDRLTGSIEPVCLNFWGFASAYRSYAAHLSADGRYVAFVSDNGALTVQPGPGPTVIWKDMQTGATINVNEAPQGGPSNNWANAPAISGDGCVTAFVTKATNLVPGTSGGAYQVYVRACDVASPTVYCKPSNVPGGCAAHMEFQGAPSATAGWVFTLGAQGIDAQQPSLLFYGVGFVWGKPLLKGRLCLRPPVVRAHASSSGGTLGCDGSLSMDFNSWIASGTDPRLVPGQPVFAQIWHRNSAGEGQLSDAVAFLIGP